MVITDPSYFGCLIFGEPETVELTSSGDPTRSVTVTREGGEWRPPARLAEFFPEGFSISIDCYTGTDGLRRIVPRCSFEGIIELGAVGGLAVIQGTRDSDSHVDHSYRAMRLIHQHVRGRAHCGSRGMREHLTRNFEYSRDLFVRRIGRLSDDERDVLPDDVGLNANGQGDRLAVGQLTELGRRAAHEAGHNNPTNQQAIAFGLFEAARRNPLEVESDQVPVLVQMALFDIDATEHPPSEGLIEIVTERLLEAIDRHRDDSREEFDQWFSGPGNSLVKQISQQKKRGGRLRHDEVRQALLHLGWRAYRYVGQCVNALMRTIKNSMPEPLTDEESQLFERMHESQSCYGDLPLALLAERASSIHRAVLAIWEDPQNHDHDRVLFRLLAYYADMARKRREADRRSKRRCQDGFPTSSERAQAINQVMEEDAAPHLEDQNPEEDRHATRGHHAGSGELIDNVHSPLSVERNRFTEVAEHIRELRGIDCDADCGRWEYRRDGDSLETVTIAMRCECGRVAQSIDMPIDEFATHAVRILQ